MEEEMVHVFNGITKREGLHVSHVIHDVVRDVMPLFPQM